MWRNRDAAPVRYRSVSLILRCRMRFPAPHPAVSVALLLVAAALGLGAQADVPAAAPPRWAAEAVVNGGGASLLRFFSSRTAVQLGLYASYQRSTGPVSTSEGEGYNLTPSIGIRRY